MKEIEVSDLPYEEKMFLMDAASGCSYTSKAWTTTTNKQGIG